MSENVLNNFSKYFVNNPPEKFIIDFNQTQKVYKRISTTAKIGSVILRASWCCIPLSILTAPFQISELTAGIGAAYFAAMAVGIGTNLISKKMYNNFVNKQGQMDYINYVLYNENKKLEKWVTKEKNTHSGEREKIGLIKRNLSHLVTTQLQIATQVNVVEEYLKTLRNEGEISKDLYDESKQLNITRLLNNYDYIASHIASNKELYSKLAPEHKQSIDFSVLHASKLEKLTEPFTSPEYVEKRLELEEELPIATQFYEQEQ